MILPPPKARTTICAQRQMPSTGLFRVVMSRITAVQSDERVLFVQGDTGLPEVGHAGDFDKRHPHIGPHLAARTP